MIKRLILTAAVAAGITGAASAQGVATNPDECLNQAFELAQQAEKKNLDDAKLDKLEEMLTKMETHCDAKQFTEAAAVAKDIEGVIGK